VYACIAVVAFILQLFQVCVDVDNAATSLCCSGTLFFSVFLYCTCSLLLFCCCSIECWNMSVCPCMLLLMLQHLV